MASFDYSEILEVADELIDEFGITAQLSRGGVLRYCTVVRIDYRPQDRDGDMIKQTDRRYLVAAGGLALPPDSEEDRLVVLGEDLRIVTVTPLMPANVPIFYEVQTRK